MLRQSRDENYCLKSPGKVNSSNTNKSVNVLYRRLFTSFGNLVVRSFAKINLEMTS